MGRRVRAGTLGGLAGGLAAGLLLWVSPWRPEGLWVGLAVMLVVAPLCVAGGTAMALARHGGRRDAARITGLGTPAAVLAVMLFARAVASTRAPGLQQVVALAVGGALAGLLGARFSGDEAG